MGKYWGEYNWNQNLPIGEYKRAKSLNQLNFNGFIYRKFEVRPGLWVTDDLRTLKPGDRVYFKDTDEIGEVYGSHHGNITCCGYYRMPKDLEIPIASACYGYGTTLKDTAGAGYRVL